MLLTWPILVCLFGLAIGQDDRNIPRFPTVDSLPSFHSRATVRYKVSKNKIRNSILTLHVNQTTGRTIFFEEYYDVPNGRGRLDRNDGTKTLTSLYDDNTQQEVVIDINRDIKNCYVADLKTAADRHDELGLSWGFFDMAVSFTHARVHVRNTCESCITDR